MVMTILFLFFSHVNLLLIYSFLFSLNKTTKQLTMAAPALKDCPKVATDLKSQLEAFSTDNLKNTDTCEKIILPSAEGMNCIF